MTRSFFTFFFTVTAAISHAANQDPQAWTFFEKHCLECHDDLSAEGDLDLFELDTEIQGKNAVHSWTRIYDQVSSGEMPPEKKPRPDSEVRDQFLEWLAPRLTLADRKEREVVQRRLNRVEYENTIRELLQINISLQDLLPEDQKAGGFDNNGAALAVSAELIERYLQTARLALDEAIVHGESPKTETFTVDSLNEVERYLGKQYGLDDDRVVAYLTDKGQYSKISTRSKRLPKRGRFRFRFTAATHRSEEPIVFSVVASDFKGVGATYLNLGYFEAGPEPKTFEIEKVLDKNFAIQFFAHGLPKWINNPASGEAPGVGFGPVEITGPIVEQWPPVSHRSLLGDVSLENGTAADARQILKTFLPRAFRRPVTSMEVDRFHQLVTNRLDAGRSFESSLRVGLEAVLSSPNFLYLREDAEPERDAKLSAHELANRVSYFLWSGPPDEQLIEAVANDSLDVDLDRILSHTGTAQFIEHFTGQWLGLRKIEETTPDSKLYPDFDEFLQVSMVKESHAFFRKLLSEDLNISNLIDSDFIMANERLAQLYQLPEVKGIGFRPVALVDDSVRGGVLTQAGVLKVTANGTNTSPVVRGVWVLENILGDHVPPPPPNIAGIEPDIREATTIREQLDAHRNSESCRSCHQLIDPPGFALESFDPVGGYRENYLQFKVNPEHADKGWGSVIKAKEVDASGQLKSGEPFQNIREFKALLLRDPEPFATTLTQRLLTYGLGRELGFSDRPAVADIVRKTSEKGNGLRTLVKEIILSEIFATP